MKKLFVALSIFVGSLAHAQAGPFAHVRLTPQLQVPAALTPTGSVGFWTPSTGGMAGHPVWHSGGLDYDLLNCTLCSSNASSLQGFSVANSTPSSGHLLIYNGSTWTPRLLSFSDLSTPGLIGTGAQQIPAGNDSRFPPPPGTDGNFVVDSVSGYTSRMITVPDLPLSTCVPISKYSGADFGARLASAIAALPSTGGCVDTSSLWGPQTISSSFNVDRPVTVFQGASQLVFGAGVAVNITAGAGKASNFRWEGYDAYSSSITVPSGGVGFLMSGDFFDNVGDARQQITIKNVRVDGGGTATSFFKSQGFPTTNFQDGQILFDSVSISNFAGIAVNIGNSVYHVRIQNSYFYHNYQGLWIDNNSESTVRENWFIQACGGGDQFTYIGPMALIDHNYFYRCAINDSANSADLRLMPVAAWPSQSGGYVWVINNRFGSERENFDPKRRRVLLRSDDTADPSHTVIGGPVIFRGNRLLGPSSGATCSANGTTATVALSAPHTTQGLQAGNNIVITTGADQHFNGPWQIASVVDSTHLTFTLPSSVTATGSCVMFSGDAAPIEQDNPHLQWSVNDNYFAGYRYLDDDEQPLPTSSNAYGLSRWGNNDSADNDVNQTFPGFQIFKNGGKLFTLVVPNAESPDTEMATVARPRESRKLENRLFLTESLNTWPQSNGITTQTGQADHLGGTRAFLLTNSGTTPSSQHIGTQFDKTGMSNGQRVLVKFWAKAGTVKTVTVGLFDSQTASFEGNLDKFTLSTDWKQYQFWTNPITTANTYTLSFYPGDTTWLNGSVYIVEPQVSTFNCDYLPNTSGSVMAQDTAAGSRFEQALLASTIKPDPLSNLLTIAGAVAASGTWTFTTAPAFQKNSIGTTPTVGASTQNTTAATASVTQQISPINELMGHRWNTTTLADETVACGWMLNPLPGATGSLYARGQWECKAPGSSYSATGTYIDSSGDIFVQGSSTLNGSVQFQSAQKHHGRTVADINTTVTTSDHYIGYTSITAPRTVTVNPALIGASATEVWPLTVKDESGNASATNTITVTLSSGTWDGGVSTSYTCVSSGGGFCSFYCDGTNCYHTASNVQPFGAVANTNTQGNDERMGLSAVQQYGASTGSSDNSTAIHNCLTAASTDATRRTCVLPAGTFQIASILTVPAAVTLQGAGAGQTVIAYTPATGTALTFAAGGSQHVKGIEFRATNAAYSGTLATAAVNTLWLENVGWRCLSGSGTCTGAAYLLDLTNSINVTINGRGFFWGAQSCLAGVHSGGGGFSNVVTVTGQVFNYCEQYAIFQPSDNWNIDNDTFEPTTLGYPSGIYETATFVTGLKISNSYFSDASAAHAGNNWIDLLCAGCDISNGNLFVNGYNVGGLTTYPLTQVSSIIFETGSRGIHFSGNYVIGGEDITVPACTTTSTMTSQASAQEYAFSGNYLLKLVDGTAAVGPNSCLGGLQTYLINANSINVNNLNVTTAFSPTGTFSALGNFNFRGFYQTNRHTVSDANYTVNNAQTGDYGISYISLTAARTVTVTPGGAATTPRELYIDDFNGFASSTNTISVAMASGTINGQAGPIVVINQPYGAVYIRCDGTNCTARPTAPFAGAGISVAQSGGMPTYSLDTAHANTFSAYQKQPAGSGGMNMVPSGALHTAIASTTSSTTGAVTVDSFTFKQNTLDTNGQSIRIFAAASHAANTNSATMRVKLGTVTVATLSQSGSNISGADMTFEAICTRINSTTLYCRATYLYGVTVQSNGAFITATVADLSTGGDQTMAFVFDTATANSDLTAKLWRVDWASN